MSTYQNKLTWCEIDKNTLIKNVKTLKKIIGPKVLLAPSVKANAYGHGLIKTTKICLQAGADLLCINALFEAEELRKAGIKKPIYIMGYVLKKDLPEAIRLGCHLVVYNRETVSQLEKAAARAKKTAYLHMKIETGNNRQGVAMEDTTDFAEFITQHPHLRLEGIATHFANIEDIPLKSGLQGYPLMQLKNFQQILKTLTAKGFHIPLPHCANSAATLLFPETHCTMVRPGIAVYGLWPSEEVKKEAEQKKGITLRPVLSWKTKIAQIKNIAKGAAIGYGCTYIMKRDGKIAILPVGYYDGYDRGLSNRAHVLIRGKKAPVRGRICMNMMMVDVTNIPGARVEDTATLLGRDGGEEITAEYLAEMAGTINYEITTRIREGIPRIIKSN